MTARGLRERKKDRTRATITRVALQLFARDGFHATTIPDIAAAAEVAPRTVSTYFPSKEGIVFDVYEESIARLGERLTRRVDGQDVLDVLREAIVEEGVAQEVIARGVVLERGPEEPDLARMREAAIASDRDLWALQRLHARPLVTILADAAAEDLGIDRQSLPALIVGESIVTVLLAVNSRAARLGTSTAAEFDRALPFLRAGLSAAAG